MSTETHQVETLVVVAGIAGLATALELARQGRAVHVIERAERFGEVGAGGIQLAPSALPGRPSTASVMDAIMQETGLAQKKRYLDAVTGEEIATIDLGPQFVERYGYPYVRTHRADLDGVLRGCRDQTSRDAGDRPRRDGRAQPR